MLPTEGFFSSFPCPYFDSGSCERPHCHFRHCREDKLISQDEEKSLNSEKIIEKQNINAQNKIIQHLVAETVKQVLSRTEITETSTIGSVDTKAIVDDVVKTLNKPGLGSSSGLKEAHKSYSRVESAPSYKPTPISELNKKHIPVMCVPTKPVIELRKKRQISEFTNNSPIYGLQYGSSELTSKDSLGRPRYENAIPDKGGGRLALASSANFGNEDASYRPFIYESEENQAVFSPEQDDIEDNEESLVDLLEEDMKKVHSDRDAEISDVLPSGKVNSHKEATISNALHSHNVDSPKETKISDVSSSEKVHSRKDAKVSDARSEKVRSHKEAKTSHLHSEKVHSHKDAKTSDAHSEKVRSHKDVKTSHVHPEKVHSHKEVKTSHVHSEKVHSHKDAKTSGAHSEKVRSHKEAKSSDVHSEKVRSHKNSRTSDVKSSDKVHSRKEFKVSDALSADSKKLEIKKEKGDSSNESVKLSVNGKCAKRNDISEDGHSHDRSDSKDMRKKKKHKHKHSKRSSNDKSEEKSSSTKHTSSRRRSYSPCEIEEVVISDDSNGGYESMSDPYATDPVIEIESSGSLSPPPKKKRLDSDPQMSLCERWRKVRETLNNRPTSERVKVFQVPNVSSLLNAKDNLLSRAKRMSPPRPSTTQLPMEEEPSIVSKIKRISHVAKVDYPTLLVEPDLKVPMSVRQLGLNNIFDEICKYVDASKAKELAQTEELKICKRVHVVKTYKNSIAMTILRIRKDKGVIQEEKETKNEKRILLMSSSVPDFTYGLSIYKCFAKYFMTAEDFVANGFPIELKSKKGCAYVDKSARRPEAKQPEEPNSRICANCSSHYFITDTGFPVKENDCFYHWGKVIKVKGTRGWVEKYRCCGSDVGADPCTTGQYHVSSTFNEDCLEGFVRTPPLAPGQTEDAAGIYAMDCEMCFTTKGSELTRCTLVDLNGQVVYDKVVVPQNPILDYCTRFSGMTEEIIGKSNNTLKTIQKDLLRMINRKTILLGHSLENDFKALKLMHRTVVDTSIVFPHKMGLPYKNALKRLAKDLLNLCIQENESGHDSFEDANTCMQIMLWKIKEDAKQRKPRVIIALNEKRK